MKLGIKKLTENSKIPTYGSEKASGFDLYSIDTISIPSGEKRVVRTGIALEIPSGHEVQIRPRSGLSAKTTLRVSNSPGTIDEDYKGEILILIDNISQSKADNIKITSGDRIAQGVLVPVVRPDLYEVEELSESERSDGALGSTGQ